MNEKILVVDDEESIRNLCKRMLEVGKYSVKLAASGEEAVEFVKEENYNVAIVDLRLPGINGLQVLKKVKEINKECEVIILTAHAGLDTAMEAIRTGVYDYIIKPFDIAKLNLVVNRCIEKQRLKEEIRNLKNELEKLKSEKNTCN